MGRHAIARSIYPTRLRRYINFSLVEISLYLRKKNIEFGSDYDVTLPRIRSRTRFKRQQLVEAGNITLFSSVERPSKEILTTETSEWTRRAWTFREKLLSRRRLVFTDEQVWWRCLCTILCEQSQLDIIDAIGFRFSGYLDG